MKILVTGANGDIGEAVGRILQQVFPDASITGADAAGRWPGGFVFANMVHLPLATELGYEAQLRELAAEYDLIIPTSEPELAWLAQSAVLYQELPLLMIRPELLNIFMDKYNTVRFFEKYGLPAPKTKLFEDVLESDLPVYVKPRRGAGGRGHMLVRTPDELKYAQKIAQSDWIAQQYLDGTDNEYTCALSRLKGKIRHVVLKRKLQGGQTVRAEVVVDDRINKLLADLAQIIDLDGCINVQLKVTSSGPIVFEINPRLSSTVMMRHLLGFNDCESWVRSFLGLEEKQVTLPNSGDVVYRMSIERVVPA